MITTVKIRICGSIEISAAIILGICEVISVIILFTTSETASERSAPIASMKGSFSAIPSMYEKILSIYSSELTLTEVRSPFISISILFTAKNVTNEKKAIITVKNTALRIFLFTPSLEFSKFIGCFRIKAMIKAIINGKEIPIDVYDAATWMSVTALSAASVATDGMVQFFPDFTRGKWVTRKHHPVTDLPGLKK